jgi:hypothetical protein
MDGFEHPLGVGGEQDEDGPGRGFFQGLEKGIGGLNVKPIRPGENGHFSSSLTSPQGKDAAQLANLIDIDDPELVLRTKPEEVWMPALKDLNTGTTLETRFSGKPAKPLDRRLKAIHGRSQSEGCLLQSGHRLPEK